MEAITEYIDQDRRNRQKKASEVYGKLMDVDVRTLEMFYHLSLILGRRAHDPEKLDLYERLAYMIFK